VNCDDYKYGNNKRKATHTHYDINNNSLEIIEKKKKNYILFLTLNGI